MQHAYKIFDLQALNIFNIQVQTLFKHVCTYVCSKHVVTLFGFQLKCFVQASVYM